VHLPSGQLGLLIRGLLQKDPLSNGTRATEARHSEPSPAARQSRPVPLPSPTQLGALPAREAPPPSEAISDSALSSTTSKADWFVACSVSGLQQREFPASVLSPSLQTRLVAGSLPGRLERLLAACAHRNAASPHFPFGGSSSPSQAPLLAFPIRLTCTAIPPSFHDIHDIHDSRYSPFAIQHIRPPATRLLHLPIKFSCMDPDCR